MHEGYVLDGYYEFTEGLGVFFKDIVGNYLIHRLEIKVDVIDVEFENSMFVKTTLMGLPQVIMHMEAMPAKVLHIKSRRLIYVAHVKHGIKARIKIGDHPVISGVISVLKFSHMFFRLFFPPNLLRGFYMVSRFWSLKKMCVECVIIVK